MSYPAENPSLSNIWAVGTDTGTLRSKLLDLLCQVAYREGNFTLSSGQPSSYYINCKPVTLDPQGAVAVGRLMLEMLDDDVEAVAGLTLGADPIVSSVSVVSAYENRPIPALIIRKEAKGHGTQAYIEGPILALGSKVVVLEDVVTTGQSAMKAVTRLRDAGYVVDQVISLVDRKQGGSEFYQSQGLKFDVVYEIEEIKQRYSLKN